VLAEFVVCWLLVQRFQVTVPRRPVIATQELLRVRDLIRIMPILIAHDREDILHVQQPLVIFPKILRRIYNRFLRLHTAVATALRGVLLTRSVITETAVALPAPFQRDAGAAPRRCRTDTLRGVGGSLTIIRWPSDLLLDSDGSGTQLFLELRRMGAGSCQFDLFYEPLFQLCHSGQLGPELCIRFSRGRGRVVAMARRRYLAAVFRSPPLALSDRRELGRSGMVCLRSGAVLVFWGF